MKVFGLCVGEKAVSKECIRFVWGGKNMLSKHVCLQFCSEQSEDSCRC